MSRCGQANSVPRTSGLVNSIFAELRHDLLNWIHLGGTALLQPTFDVQISPIFLGLHGTEAGLGSSFHYATALYRLKTSPLVNFPKPDSTLSVTSRYIKHIQWENVLRISPQCTLTSLSDRSTTLALTRTNQLRILRSVCVQGLCGWVHYLIYTGS